MLIPEGTRNRLVNGNKWNLGAGGGGVHPVSGVREKVCIDLYTTVFACLFCTSHSKQGISREMNYLLYHTSQSKSTRQSTGK
jgi:hypothetical protein